MVVGIFLPHSGALAEGSGKYNIDFAINIHNKDELLKKIKNGDKIEASHREVKVYKLKIDGELTDEDRLKLAKEYDSLTIAEAEKKLKDEKKFEKEIPTEKSKYIYGDKLYDVIDPRAIKDFKLENLNLDREKILIRNLDKGYYLIKETDDSKKITDQKLITFVVKLPNKDMKDKDTLELDAKVVKDVPKKSLKLIKVDAENNDIRINKTQFALYKKSKDGKKDELVKVTGEKGKYFYNEEKGATIPLETWDKGELTVENLPEGIYYFKETKPADNYNFEGNTNINQESDKVELGKTVTVQNRRPPTIKKYDDKTGKPLYNAKFKLFTKDDKPVKFTYKNDTYFYDTNGKEEMVASNNQGSIYVKGLPNGTYYFKEIEPPNRYYIKDADRKYSFDYKDGHMKVHDGGYYLSIGNSKIHTDKNPTTPKGGFNFVKIDCSKEEHRLANAKFILMKKSGETYERVLVNGKEVSLTSKDNGEFAIDGLEYGEYALKEVKAPDNYVIVNELTPFTVDAASSSLPAKKIVNMTCPPVKIVSKENTITTKYVPGNITTIVKNTNMIVKTGDVKIIIMSILGLILLAMGIKLVKSGERLQRV